MATLTERPVVRTGKCSLILVIDGRRYRVSPAPPLAKGSKIWHLKVLPGQVRAGKLYSVISVHGHVDCTCPDSVQTHAVCKHIRALQVLGLVAKTAKPSIMVAWENTQPCRRRKPPVPALTGPVPLPLPAPVKAVKAKTRRLHVAALPDDGTSFAAGFRDAVRSHLAGMAAAKGGAL
jgi:hypothetical protein